MQEPAAGHHAPEFSSKQCASAPDGRGVPKTKIDRNAVEG
jgi:hypothetical protein